MRYLVSITLLAFSGSLFFAGQALSRGDEATKQSGSAQLGQERQIGAGSQQQGSQQIASGQLSNSQVREIQETLKDRGYDVGSVDGIIGPRTSEALREFQLDEAIAASGNINRQTLQALDVEIKEQEFLGVSPAFGKDQQQLGRDQQKDPQQIGRDRVQFGGGDEQVVKRGQGKLRSEDVKELQKKLSEHGHEVGPVDGLYGPKTEQALREFQQSQGIVATGQINRETLESLGLDSEEFFGISPKFQEEQRQRRQDEQQKQMKKDQPHQNQMNQQQERQQQTPERKY